MTKSRTMPWVKIVNHMGMKVYKKVYKFNVFLTDLAKPMISKKHLKSIINAHIKNGNNNFAKDWQTSFNIRMYGEQDMLNPKLFQGNRIPIYLVYGLLIPNTIVISNQIDQNTNSSTSFPNKNYQGNIQSFLGPTFPVPNCFPDWTPWGAIDLLNIQNKIITNKTNNNPFAITNFEQYVSYALSWGLCNISINDMLLTNTSIDFYVPIIDTWHYAEIDESGNCTNSVLDPDSGYYLLPTFKEKFPEGGYIDILNIPIEQLFSTSKLSSFYVDKWRMANYTLTTYWDAYYTGGNLKFDKMGLFKQPLDNYLNNHYISKFIYKDGTSYTGSIINSGPATYLQIGKDITFKFPPNYTYVTLSPLF